ncbi:polyphosphate kinase 1 [Neolewinella agarilytica]|uniref:Polyphosphate kinase n=1 Tax=Neolewinella agarilytica TaxID=478744 RepID=A0A1H9HH05_9BACT|nr:polyphosphate kinase 1 [Neolewinella agarilytica]SEQ61577.1 polyphosphate kinase [Neolewinella agarilytica]
MKHSLIKRDTSWLHFNRRVLQEADNPLVPLYERLKFLAIHSSNLDEFYRVRVASLRQFKKVNKAERKNLFDFTPKNELRIIRAKVREQQKIFDKIFRKKILPQLKEENIHLIHGDEMTEEQAAFTTDYFDKKVKPNLHLHWLPENNEDSTELPFLKSGQLCLAVHFNEKPSQDGKEVALVPIPSETLPRFIVLPSPPDATNGYYVIFLDSIIRANLSRWIDREVTFGYSFKLSRDAELYIEDEFDGELHHKIAARLRDREDGLPTRFLFDRAMPSWIRKRLKKVLNLSRYDMIMAGRYHNFMDFFRFPLPPGREDLTYPELPPLPHPRLGHKGSIMKTMEASDLLLSFPYQQYDYVPRLIREAANHPEVEKICITLYRVAGKSAVVQELLYALAKGKDVEAFVEAKARFDEASNLYWGKELEEAGAYVRYSIPEIKVHTKLLHILRKKPDGETNHYSYIGTGNFNEKTAKLYTDHALMTCRPRIGKDVIQVFRLLRGKLILPKCKKLLVAPFSMYTRFIELIDEEIARAKAGKTAYLFFKMNSLEEESVINKIREAAAEGVKVRMIVRGICRLAPSKEENIEIISIVDRFLEHARIYIFGGSGQEKVFLGSADMMERNLHRRVEVITPIEDQLLRLELRRIMDMQWSDNQKARIISATQLNTFREPGNFRAQKDIYQYFKRRNHLVLKEA